MDIRELGYENGTRMFITSSLKVAIKEYFDLHSKFP